METSAKVCPSPLSCPSPFQTNLRLSVSAAITYINYAYNNITNICVFTDTMFSQSTTIIVDKFPSALRTKLTSNIQTVTSKDTENARIRKDCPNCAATEMTWSEAQLRSVDEGTTIFFRCPECGHRFEYIPAFLSISRVNQVVTGSEKTIKRWENFKIVCHGTYLRINSFYTSSTAEDEGSSNCRPPNPAPWHVSRKAAGCLPLHLVPAFCVKRLVMIALDSGHLIRVVALSWTSLCGQNSSRFRATIIAGQKADAADEYIQTKI